MELVYLWVEKYKNIENQGFNFSSKFICSYKNNDLAITKNDNCIKNFFGNNINVAAIVGENGSGKSSILNIIMNLLGDNIQDSKKRHKYLLIYNIGDRYYLLKHYISNKINKPDWVIENPNQKSISWHSDLIVVYLNNELHTNYFRNHEQIFTESSQQNKKEFKQILISNFIDKRNKNFEEYSDEFFIRDCKINCVNPPLVSKSLSVF